jgi:hypothetical protein
MNKLDKIQNPKTGKWVNITSKNGLVVLENYINMIGGAILKEKSEIYVNKVIDLVKLPNGKFIQPSSMQPSDHRAILMVGKDAIKDETKRNDIGSWGIKELNTVYKFTTLKYHPDRNPGVDGASDAFRYLNDANDWANLYFHENVPHQLRTLAGPLPPSIDNRPTTQERQADNRRHQQVMRYVSSQEQAERNKAEEEARQQDIRDKQQAKIDKEKRDREARVRREEQAKKRYEERLKEAARKEAARKEADRKEAAKSGRSPAALRQEARERERRIAEKEEEAARAERYRRHQQEYEREQRDREQRDREQRDRADPIQLLRDAITIGATLWNNDRIEDCVDVYLKALREHQVDRRVPVERRDWLIGRIRGAVSLANSIERGWHLRETIDTILARNTHHRTDPNEQRRRDQQRSSPKTILIDAISKGILLFNDGRTRECANLYERAIEDYALHSRVTRRVSDWVTAQILSAVKKRETSTERAWSLRRIIDNILSLKA